MMLTKEECAELLKLARNVMKRAARGEFYGRPKNYPGALDRKLGVACTIRKGEELYSAVAGFPLVVSPAVDSVMNAVSSLVHDSNVQAHEIDEIKIELWILAEPEPLKFSGIEDLLRKIPEDGGVMLRYGPYEAFLVRHKSDETAGEQFLDSLCEKAGLEKGMWKEKNVELYRFDSQVIKEE